MCHNVGLRVGHFYREFVLARTVPVYLEEKGRSRFRGGAGNPRLEDTSGAINYLYAMDRIARERERRDTMGWANSFAFGMLLGWAYIDCNPVVKACGRSGQSRIMCISSATPAWRSHTPVFHVSPFSLLCTFWYNCTGYTYL